MKHMQIKAGQKLHRVYEPGKGIDHKYIVPAKHVSVPICGLRFDKNGSFRMTINFSLGNACKNCYVSITHGI